MSQFTKHSFEQIIRFTRVPWEELSSDRREQLYFNAGSLAALLSLGKEQSYDLFEKFKLGKVTPQEIEFHFLKLAQEHKIEIDMEAAYKPFENKQYYPIFGCSDKRIVTVEKVPHANKDYVDLVTSVLKCMKNLPKEHEERIYIDKDKIIHEKRNSDHTNFDWLSDFLQIGVLSDNDKKGYAMLKLLKMIIDKDPMMVYEWPGEYKFDKDGYFKDDPVQFNDILESFYKKSSYHEAFIENEKGFYEADIKAQYGFEIDGEKVPMDAPDNHFTVCKSEIRLYEFDEIERLARETLSLFMNIPEK
jgi:hypothetical protein